ncbi:MAG: magnesium transporter [Thermoguttaceae bacterium]
MPQRPTTDHLSEPVIAHARKDFVRVLVEHTVGEALAYVQQSRVEGRIVYFYVVDQTGRLVGVVPTRRLLLNPPETKIADIMVRQVIAIPEHATLADACEFFILHRLLALPVVDAHRRIVGVIDVELYTEEISDLAQREQSEAVFQLIGIRLAELQRASLAGEFRQRFPWLLWNIAGGLACAALAACFEGVLQEAIVLALFIPVVLALGESVAVQTLTLSLQAHHGLRLNWPTLGRLLRRESTQGLLLGLGAGGLVGLAALGWHGRGLIALVIFDAILASTATAALLGLLVPAAFRALQRDPRIASGPIVLAMTDLATLFYYFGLAAWLLR